MRLLFTPPSGRSLEQWGEEIQRDIRLRGFSRGSTQIDQRALHDAFLTRFTPILRILPEAAPGDWLEAIVRKHRKAVAPLHHILVRLLINSLPLSRASNPFGIGPWPCRNQLAEHFGRSVITDCKLHKDGGKTIGVFRCSCGHAFSTASEPNSRMRILDFGPLFEAALLKLVADGCSLRGAARELSVDPNTILRYVALLGLKTPWKARSMPSRLKPIEREDMRSAWENELAMAPNSTRQQLRRRIPAVYAWLYRNDRDWLNTQLPSGFRHNRRKPRKDWQSIDTSMAQTLRQEAARLRQLSPPQQITKLTLERALGRPH